MNSKRPSVVFSIPLVVFGFCMASAVAQEQICFRVDGPLFSVSSNPANNGWNCHRVADPDAPPNNIMGMGRFVLNVDYFDDPTVPLDNGPYGNNCFVDSRTGENGVMTSTLQVRLPKNKPIWFTFWGHGYDISGLVDVLYMIQYVNPVDVSGPLPPPQASLGSTEQTDVWFADWLIETEGRGKLRKETCTGTGAIDPSIWPPPHLSVQRCWEQSTDPSDPNGRPLPCP